MRKNNKGFTIMELLVVVVIMGIIISLVSMSISRYIAQGKDTVNEKIESQLELMAKSYYSDNKKELLLQTENPEDKGLVWYQTLKNTGYVTNELVDADGNKCSNSYVVVQKTGNNYDYNGCIICGNNNLANKDECNISRNFLPSCTLSIADNSEIIRGSGSAKLRLECSGKGLIANNIDEDSFSIEENQPNHGYIDSVTKIDSNEETIIFEAIYKANSSTILSDAISIYFKAGYISNDKAFSNENSNTVSIKIKEDAAPVCSITGPYKNNNYNSIVSYANNGTNLEYKISCTDTVDLVAGGGFTQNKISISDVSTSSQVSLVSEGTSFIENQNITKYINVKVGTGDGPSGVIFNTINIKDSYGNYSNTNVSNHNLTVDNTKPTCSFSSLSSIYQGSSGSITLTCTDSSGIAYKNLSSSDFSVSGITISSISSPSTVTNGYRYTITVRGSSIGYGSISLLANSISDNAGNLNTGTSSNSINIMEKPSIPTPSTPSLVVSSGTAGTNGWYKSNVTLTASGGGSYLSYYRWSDSTTGSTKSITTETDGTTYSVYACNTYGDCSSPASITIKIDKTAPTCSDISMKKYSSYCPEDAIGDTYKSGYWTQCGVAVTATGCSDPGVYASGLASGSSTFSKNYLTEKTHTVDLGLVDMAGNTSSNAGTVKIDRTAPYITWTAGSGSTLVDGGNYYQGLSVIGTCTDSGGSGVTGLTPIYIDVTADLDTGVGKSSLSNGVGTNTYTFPSSVTGTKELYMSCTDDAGNTSWEDHSKYNTKVNVNIKKTYYKTTCTRSATYAWVTTTTGGSKGTVSKSTADEWCKNNGYTATYASCSGRTASATYEGKTCRTATGANGSKVYCTIKTCQASGYTSWSCGSATKTFTCTESTGTTSKVECDPY